MPAISSVPRLLSWCHVRTAGDFVVTTGLYRFHTMKRYFTQGEKYLINRSCNLSLSVLNSNKVLFRKVAEKILLLYTGGLHVLKNNLISLIKQEVAVADCLANRGSCKFIWRTCPWVTGIIRPLGDTRSCAFVTSLPCEILSYSCTLCTWSYLKGCKNAMY